MPEQAKKPKVKTRVKKQETKAEPKGDEQKQGVGRPLKFESAEDLQRQIDAYFDACNPHVEEVTEWVEARDKSGKLLYDENGLHYLKEVTHKVRTAQIPYTITGLALALKTSRKVLVEYEDKDEYSNTIKEAKLRIERFNEEKLHGGAAPVGIIFNLKNNYGWQDKTQQENSGEQKLIFETRVRRGDDKH